MAYPNAGLPNELGDYDELPGDDRRRRSANGPRAGMVNIVGGCCGTTPDAYRGDRRRRRAALPPRAIPSPPRRTRLAGLEPMTLAA